jgi:NAD(P)-dependent dehydrogenase (short-subunit alcohol dehydrogenase family)
MSLYAAFKKPGPNGFGYASTAEEVTEGLDLSGKTYLLTGCNSGIGLETLRVLGLRGGHVIAAARSEAKARDALARTGAEGTAVACELSEPDSVRACARAVAKLERPLDAIIANAGIMALPKPQRRHGCELQLFTNHVGHFMLVTGLLDGLAEDGRVVVVSSDAHRGAPKEGIRFDDLAAERRYSPWGSYGQSKLANILFARKLAGRLSAKQTANSLHPGVIQTNLVRHMNRAAVAVFSLAGRLFLKTIAQGAATQCYLAAHSDGGASSGEYFADCNVAKPSKLGLSDRLADELWDKTEEIVAGL